MQPIGSENTIHLFVYGTLKPGAANFDRYCGNQVVSSHRAYIDGNLYHLPGLGYPGASCGTGEIHGFVLAFNDPSILHDLDELEDYDPRRQTDANEYYRELVLAYPLDRSPQISAWVYLMTPDRIRALGGILIPNGWWATED